VGKAATPSSFASFVVYRAVQNLRVSMRPGPNQVKIFLSSFAHGRLDTSLQLAEVLVIPEDLLHQLLVWRVGLVVTSPPGFLHEGPPPLLEPVALAHQPVMCVDGTYRRGLLEDCPGILDRPPQRVDRASQPPHLLA
jgi:hypothetical protein